MPENGNILDFEVVPTIGKRQAFKSVDEYSKYLENNISEAIEKGLVTPINEAEGKFQSLYKSAGKFKRILLKVSDDRKSVFSVRRDDKTYTKSQISKIANENFITNQEVKKAEEEAIKKTREQEDRKRKRASELSNIIGSNLTGIDLTRFQLGEKKSLLSDLKKQFQEVEEGSDKYTELKQKIENTQKEINQLTDDLKRQNQELIDSKKLSGWQKFLNRFKSYGFIRIFRNAFSFIEKGFSTGLDSLIKFDSEANKTMSSIQTSIDKMNASIVLLVMPLIEIIEPVLTSLSNGISSFANNISMASAYMKGLGEYTKVSEEYMKDLQQEANATALSFDKFESLNAQISPFEKAKIKDEDKEKAEQYADTIERIQSIFGKVWEFVKTIGKILLDTFVKIEPYLDDVFDLVLLIADVIAGIVVDIVKFVAKIGEFIDSKADLVALLGIITGIATAIAFATGRPITGILTIIGGAMAVGSITKSVEEDISSSRTRPLRLPSASKPTSISTPEVGLTKESMKGVVNEVLYENDISFNQKEPVVVLEVDGAEIARSKSFKNELNRTNSGLNLR